MHITLPRAALAAALTALSNVVGSRNAPRPILADVLVRADHSGITATANDLDIAGTLALQGAVYAPGEAAIPAARLASIVREIPGDELELEAAEGGKVHLCAPGYALTLLGDDPNEYPALEVPAGERTSLPREGFAAALRRVSSAAAQDVGRYQLTGVFFEEIGGCLALTATDGKRLAHERTPYPACAGLRTIAPNRAVAAILSFLSACDDDEIALSSSPQAVGVFTRPGHLYARSIEGSYPDYTVAIPKADAIRTRVEMPVKDLTSAVRAASLVTDRESATVALTISEGSVAISSRASDIGESRIEVRADVEGEALEIRFNPVYLLAALKTLDGERVRVELAGSDRPGAMVEGGYRHLCMPLVVG